MEIVHFCFSRAVLMYDGLTILLYVKSETLPFHTSAANLTIHSACC